MTPDDEKRLVEDEALLLLTNRIVLDYISLQVDSGAFPLEEAKRLVRYSANEVKRGAPSLAGRVDFFADVFVDRFAKTTYGPNQR